MITLARAKQKQQELHNTATKILTEKDITKQLQKYGTVRLIGSYAAELMVKPDIDIEIINPDISSNEVLELTKFFFQMPGNYSVEIADGTEYIRRAGHPRGYYVGPGIMFEGMKWGLDIWLMQSPHEVPKSTYTALASHDWYKKASQVELDTILLLKHQLAEKDEYKKFASANVYQSVLDGEVQSLGDFYKWAEKFDTQAAFRRN